MSLSFTLQPFSLSGFRPLIWFPICSMINAFSEGLVLADKSGLNPQTLLDVLVSKQEITWLCLTFPCLMFGKFFLKGPGCNC